VLVVKNDTGTALECVKTQGLKKQSAWDAYHTSQGVTGKCGKESS
jgi:hypothetical protein